MLRRLSTSCPQNGAGHHSLNSRRRGIPGSVSSCGVRLLRPAVLIERLARCRKSQSIAGPSPLNAQRRQAFRIFRSVEIERGITTLYIVEVSHRQTAVRILALRKKPPFQAARDSPLNVCGRSRMREYRSYRPAWASGIPAATGAGAYAGAVTPRNPDADRRWCGAMARRRACRKTAKYCHKNELAPAL